MLPVLSQNSAGFSCVFSAEAICPFSPGQPDTLISWYFPSHVFSIYGLPSFLQLAGSTKFSRKSSTISSRIRIPAIGPRADGKKRQSSRRSPTRIQGPTPVGLVRFCQDYGKQGRDLRRRRQTGGRTGDDHCPAVHPVFIPLLRRSCVGNKMKLFGKFHSSVVSLFAGFTTHASRCHPNRRCRNFL